MAPKLRPKIAHTAAVTMAATSSMMLFAGVASADPAPPRVNSLVREAANATGFGFAVKDTAPEDKASLSESTHPRCARNMLVAVPGTFEIDQSADPNEPIGMIGDFAKPLRESDDFSDTYINYVADAGVNGVSYAQSVQGGVQKTLATLEDIQSRCSDALVTLAGFSQGAQVAGDVATMVGNKQTSIAPDRLSSVILFSDPRRSPSTNVIAGTSQDLPKLPRSIQDAVDRFLENPSLAQVQLSASEVADGAQAVTNAFGLGDEEPNSPGRDGSGKISSSDSSHSSKPSQSVERKSLKDRSSRSSSSSSPSSSRQEKSPQELTGDSPAVQMLPSSNDHAVRDRHSFGLGDASTIEFRMVATQTSAEQEQTSKASPSIAQEVDQSPLGDALSDEDKAQIVESLSTAREKKPVQGDKIVAPDGHVEVAGEDVEGKIEQGFVTFPVNDDNLESRQNAAVDLYRSGLCGDFTLAGCENALVGDGGQSPFALLRRVDDSTLEKLMTMHRQGRTSLLSDEDVDGISQVCRFLRATDCSSTIRKGLSETAPPVNNAALVEASSLSPATSFDTSPVNNEEDSEAAEESGASGANTPENNSSSTSSHQEGPVQDNDDDAPTKATAPEGNNEAHHDGFPKGPHANRADGTDQLPRSTDVRKDSTTDTAPDRDSENNEPAGDKAEADEVSDSQALADLWKVSPSNDEAESDSKDTDGDNNSSSNPSSSVSSHASSTPSQTPSTKDEDATDEETSDTTEATSSQESSSHAEGKDVDINPITLQGVAGGGLIGERQQDFGEVSGRVASLCVPGDIVCSMPENSDLARKLVEIGQHFTTDVSALDSASVARGDSEGMARMGGLVAVQAVNQVAELSGLPPTRLSAESVEALIRLVAGAGLIAAGDPTGAGVAMMSSVVPDLPTLLPELGEQLGDIPLILSRLKDAPDNFAKNTGLKDLQQEFDRAFKDAGITNVTELSKLPEATPGLINDLLESNSGLLKIATDPAYYQDAHSGAAFDRLKLAGDQTALDWSISWIRALDEQLDHSAGAVDKQPELAENGQPQEDVRSPLGSLMN